MRRRRRVWREKGWQNHDERAALTYKMRLALVQPSPSRKTKKASARQRRARRMPYSGRCRSRGTALKRRCAPGPWLRRLRRALGKGDRDTEATADAAARGPTKPRLRGAPSRRRPLRRERDLPLLRQDGSSTRHLRGRSEDEAPRLPRVRWGASQLLTRRRWLLTRRRWREEHRRRRVAPSTWRRRWRTRDLARLGGAARGAQDLLANARL